MIWNRLTVFVAQKLNSWTTLINAPPSIDEKARNVLIVQCHPSKDSYNTQLADAVARGLLTGGHTVKLRRLYHYDEDGSIQGRLSIRSYANKDTKCILATLSSSGKTAYHSPEHTKDRDEKKEASLSVPADIKEAVADLLWCDSLVFVYPTWWFNFPAALKGYLDRVFLPGIAFRLPDNNEESVLGGTGLVPLLGHIAKIGAVTTFGASQTVVAYAGDNSRRFLSRGLRALCARECGMSYHALYESTVCTAEKRREFLAEVEEYYSHF
ncbi:hypothetical protein EON65_48550 [archaeon]|nr:MAG: hypothetical protein EON65_48550 [archaeon]